MVTEQMRSEVMAISQIVDSDKIYYGLGQGYADLWWGDTVFSMPMTIKLLKEAIFIDDIFKRHNINANKKKEK